MPLTTDKAITTPEYWNKIYSGNNDDAKVDASNTKRVSTFDRFQIVVNQVEGPRVLEACAGHARIAERVRAARPEWYVVAADQSEEARNVSKFRPYVLQSVYELPFSYKYFDTVIVTQAFEYLEDPDRAMKEIQRISSVLVCTVPIGEMKTWSQLRIYEVHSFLVWLGKYGCYKHVSDHGDLLLAKIYF